MVVDCFVLVLFEFLVFVFGFKVLGLFLGCDLEDEDDCICFLVFDSDGFGLDSSLLGVVIFDFVAAVVVVAVVLHVVEGVL